MGLAKRDYKRTFSYLYTTKPYVAPQIGDSSSTPQTGNLSSKSTTTPQTGKSFSTAASTHNVSTNSGSDSQDLK